MSAQADQALREAVTRAYMDFYAEGFKQNDARLIDKVVKYPLAHTRGGVTRLLDQYPVNPARLKAEKQWDHSTDWHFDILAISDTEAHTVARAVRRRADGSRIESVHAFYAFTLTTDGWKIYALADLET